MSARPVLVQTSPLPPGAQAALEALPVARAWWRDVKDDPEALAAARVLVTGAGVGADAATIAALPRLELVAVMGVGLDRVDLRAAAARGVEVSHTGDALRDEVADFAVLMLLAACRRLVEADRHVRSGAWEAAPFPLNRSLRGLKVGMVGLGRIGGAAARRLQAFGVELAYWNRSEKPESGLRREADLTALAAWADALVVLVPGGAGTTGLIDGTVMRALGPEGILVNLARGEVVDEAALCAALDEGALGFAALDVFVDEPRVDPRLKASERTLLQPHQASGTVRTREAMGLSVVDSVRDRLGLPGAGGGGGR